jgi:hypothetical protein
MVRSSVASDRAGELAEDKAMAEAKVQSDAEGQVAGLKRDMSNAKQNALTLLQQTEDPTAAADAALTEVNAVKSTAPRFDPLGEMFRAAALGYTSYRDAQAAKRYRDAVPTTNPYTSSGRNVS